MSRGGMLRAGRGVPLFGFSTTADKKLPTPTKSRKPHSCSIAAVMGPYNVEVPCPYLRLCQVRVNFRRRLASRQNTELISTVPAVRAA
jgi:hypothetical protein